MAKRFVILTGAAGSGKTTMALLLARWLTPLGDAPKPVEDPPKPASPPSKPGGAPLRAKGEDMKFRNEQDEKVVLPKRLIAEWAHFVQTHPELANTPTNEVRAEFLSEYDAKQGSEFASHAIYWERQKTQAPAAERVQPQAPKSQGIHHQRHELVAVGADWSTRDPILGGPDPEDKTRYLKTSALDLILRATAEPDLPHFLILDEMNLAHVEHYLADILSAIESGEPLKLHGDRNNSGAPAIRDGVPGELRLPLNLFIIGIVNDGETTCLLSPNTLDRANVLEMRVSDRGLQRFLKNPVPIDFGGMDGAGAEFASQFVSLAQHPRPLPDKERQMFESEFLLFFEAVQSTDARLGFRAAAEGAAFLYFHSLICPGEWSFRSAMDALIVQKVLPRLQTIQGGLEPTLWRLGTLCRLPRTWDIDEATGEYQHSPTLRAESVKAGTLNDPDLDPLRLNQDGERACPSADAYYPLSFERITQLLENLRATESSSIASP